MAVNNQMTGKLQQVYGPDVAMAPATGKLQDTGVDMLLYPQSDAQVGEMVERLSAWGTPVVPLGNGTTLKAVVRGRPSGAVGVSTAHLDRLLSLERDNLSVTVQAGINCTDLQDHLSGQNMFLPTSGINLEGRTIGGLLAENAAGWESYAYGGLADHVLGIEAVIPSGEIVRAGGKTVKNASGYAFGSLFAGSFGTLGIITAVTFKVRPRPESRRVLLANLIHATQALEVSNRIMQDPGLRPASIHLTRGFFASADRLCLVVSFAGRREAVQKQMDRIEAVLEGLADSLMANENEVADFWDDIGQKQQRMEAISYVRVEFARKNLHLIHDLTTNAAVEQFVVDLGTGEGILCGNAAVVRPVVEIAGNVVGGADPSCRMTQERPPESFLAIKSAIDPRNVMFPHCSILEGRDSG